MVDYSRDIDLGKIDEIAKVSVESNVAVVNSLSKVIEELINVIEELRKEQTALSFIYGQKLDLEED